MVWFQYIAMTICPCREHGLVNLLKAVICLPIQSHHLHTPSPEDVWVKVRRIEAKAFRIHSKHVSHVMILELCLFLGILAKTASFRLVQREDMVVFTAFHSTKSTVLVALEV